MPSFEWFSIPRRGWMIIIAELIVIVSLSGWVVAEYLNNVYFQTYVNGLTPVLVPIVSVGFGMASASIATILYLRIKSVAKTSEASEDEAKPRGQRRAARKVSSGEAGQERSMILSSLNAQAAKLRPIGPGPTPARNETQTRPADKKETD